MSPPSRVPHPRELLTMGPHDHSHLPALRVVVSVVVPLALLTALGRPDLALFAVFGAFASVYGRAESHRSRARSQSLAGAALVVSISLGAVVATTGTVRPWLAVGLAAVIAAIGCLASDVLRWRPPGSFFLVFAFGTVALQRRGIWLHASRYLVAAWWRGPSPRQPDSVIPTGPA